jgi:predicted DNA-binding transcriptional regulator YafY
MSSKVIYERFLWFHAKVKAGEHPNTCVLAAQFEISRKTAQRDIEFMRDRLGAPLHYVPELRGYAYEDRAYELPGFWLGEGELISLLVSYRLASAIPDRTLKKALETFLNQVVSGRSQSGNLSLSKLNEKVSVKNIEYSGAGETTFKVILEALLQEKVIAIDYYSPHTGKETHREILPLHLLQYMGTWHIIAHCAMKDETRDFVLSRIRSIAPSSRRLSVHATASSVKEYIRQNFGIMNSHKTFEVCLRFSPKAAPWLAEQVWHPAQQIRWEKDGSLCLTFPVADLREVKREVLKYGAQVEVVKPSALRQAVKREIEKMGKNYR